MAIENNQPESKLKEAPKCAYCDAEPMMIGSKEIPTATGLVLGIAWCANCGTTLSCTVIGRQAPMNLANMDLKGHGGKLIRM